MPTIDLFCRVVDNYGDIGVCWRLARQLVAEHGCNVRLIVDDLASFRFIAPEIDPALAEQNFLGVVVIAWSISDALQPAEIVIEAFACDPPGAYVRAMAALHEKPVWINLEYLTAEAWVDGVHGLPSPHPSLPLTKYFFCPGFTEQSGGLIRERSQVPSALRGDATPLSPVGSGGAGEARGQNSRSKLLAFAYRHAPIRAVATALKAQVTSASHLDDVDPAWLSAPPVAQTQFDALLAQFDVLIVRGEDSFQIGRAHV